MTKQTRHRSIRIAHDVKFIADTHFCHPMMVSVREQPDGSTVQLRKFGTMNEHDYALVDAWNEAVRPKETVFHLGDFGFWKAPVEDLQRIFKRLHGRKFLLPGNHDSFEVESFGWEGVLRGPVRWTADDGANIVGTHHPLREWDGWHHGALHFHGHTHNSLPSSRRSMDVGIDSIGMWPLNATDLRAYMSQLPELDFKGVEVDPFEADIVEDEDAEMRP